MAIFWHIENDRTSSCCIVYAVVLWPPILIMQNKTPYSTWSCDSIDEMRGKEVETLSKLENYLYIIERSGSSATVTNHTQFTSTTSCSKANVCGRIHATFCDIWRPEFGFYSIQKNRKEAPSELQKHLLMRFQTEKSSDAEYVCFCLF